MYKGWLSNSHIGNDLVYCLLGSRVLVFVRSYELEVHANVEYLPRPSLKRLFDYCEMTENHRKELTKSTN
jgi:hypothetical protein